MNDIRRYWGGLLAFGVFLVLVALGRSYWQARR